MRNHNRLYFLLAVLTVCFIAYALIKNYLIDPGADSFLSQKNGLKRELNLPVWLNVMYIHVAFACLAMATGLLNFSATLYKKSRKLHRSFGYAYILSVMLVVLSSGYMAPYATGGKISSIGFNLINIIWPAITLVAFIQIKKKQIIRHRNWMIRSYAFCFTNMLIHLIALLFENLLGFSYTASYTAGIYGSLALLLLIPEVLLRTIAKPRKLTPL